VFLGRDYGNNDRDYSDATATIIDQEIKAIMDEAHRRSVQILTDNRDLLTRVAETLIERETISGEDINTMMRGEELPEYKKDEPPPPAEAEPSAEEKKKRETRLFGKPILDRPKEIPG
jgi:cell division protease FtsH